VPDHDVLDAGILAGLRDLERDMGRGSLDGVVASFAGDARDRIDQLRAAAAAGHRPVIVALAHSLKGSSANLAAGRMACLCGHLEDLPQGCDVRAITELLDQLDAEFVRVRTALDRAFPGSLSGGESH
jgi:HPt (histidine-containing phosphotransfer) domain-containing protein